MQNITLDSQRVGVADRLHGVLRCWEEAKQFSTEMA